MNAVRLQLRRVPYHTRIQSQRLNELGVQAVAQRGGGVVRCRLQRSGVDDRDADVDSVADTGVHDVIAAVPVHVHLPSHVHHLHHPTGVIVSIIFILTNSFLLLLLLLLLLLFSLQSDPFCSVRSSLSRVFANLISQLELLLLLLRVQLLRLLGFASFRFSLVKRQFAKQRVER
jgi:hypothetical protein